MCKKIAFCDISDGDFVEQDCALLTGEDRAPLELL
jgi:hypothetical protein